jgi:hypothetical protein
MYKLSVGCIFKNESHCIKEWILHYLHHGAEHFYMVNDNSTDDFLSIIEPYMEHITLFNAKCAYFLGRQRYMYNTYILPHIKETHWLLMVDMDEFVWSPHSINLNDELANCNHLGQIQIYDVIFGSNNLITQPPSLVNYFTMREKEPRKSLKYFINSNFNFSSLNIHHATFVDKDDERHKFMILDHTYFIVNHYSCQSRTFWNEVKCVRGDGDHYRVRTIEDFDAIDINEVEDLRLKIQNESILL